MEHKSTTISQIAKREWIEKIEKKIIEAGGWMLHSRMDMGFAYCRKVTIDGKLYGEIVTIADSKVCFSQLAPQPLDGKVYTINLNDKNHDELEQRLTRYGVFRPQVQETCQAPASIEYVDKQYHPAFSL